MSKQVGGQTEAGAEVPFMVDVEKIMQLKPDEASEQNRMLRKQLLTARVLDLLDREGALVSEDERMEYYAQEYGLEADAPVEAFLDERVSLAETVVDPATREVHVYLNPYFHLVEVDEALWATVEEKLHCDMYREDLAVGKTVKELNAAEYDYEVRAKEQILSRAEFFDFEPETVARIEKLLKRDRRLRDNAERWGDGLVAQVRQLWKD